MKNSIICKKCGQKSQVSDLVIKLGGRLCPKCHVVMPELKNSPKPYSKLQKQIKLLIRESDEIIKKEYGVSFREHYRDYEKDPVFYHPVLNLIATFAQFDVLMPEKYGWIVIGYL